VFVLVPQATGEASDGIPGSSEIHRRGLVLQCSLSGRGVYTYVLQFESSHPPGEQLMKAGNDRLVFAAWLASGLLGGANGLAIRFSNRELAPVWGAGIRFVLAGILLLAITRLLRLKFPPPRLMMGAALWGLLQFGQYGFLYYALVRVHAGIGSTMLALVPLATVFLAAAQGQERVRATTVLGALLGAGGTAVISGHLLQGEAPLPSVLALFVSVLCFAQSGVLVRRMPRMHPMVMNCIAMLAGGLVLLLSSLILGEPRDLPTRPETWAALVYLAAVGSIVVFGLVIFVLHHWSASRESYSILIVPFVATLLSAWLDGERVDAALLVGGALILVGVYIGVLRAPEASPTTETAGAD